MAKGIIEQVLKGMQDVIEKQVAEGLEEAIAKVVKHQLSLVNTRAWQARYIDAVNSRLLNATEDITESALDDFVGDLDIDSLESDVKDRIKDRLDRKIDIDDVSVEFVNDFDLDDIDVEGITEQLKNKVNELLDLEDMVEELADDHKFKQRAEHDLENYIGMHARALLKGDHGMVKAGDAEVRKMIVDMAKNDGGTVGADSNQSLVVNFNNTANASNFITKVINEFPAIKYDLDDGDQAGDIKYTF